MPARCPVICNPTTIPMEQSRMGFCHLEPARHCCRIQCSKPSPMRIIPHRIIPWQMKTRNPQPLMSPMLHLNMAWNHAAQDLQQLTKVRFPVAYVLSSMTLLGTAQPALSIPFSYLVWRTSMSNHQNRNQGLFRVKPSGSMVKAILLQPVASFLGQSTSPPIPTAETQFTLAFWFSKNRENG